MWRCSQKARLKGRRVSWDSAQARVLCMPAVCCGSQTPDIADLPEQVAQQHPWTSSITCGMCLSLRDLHACACCLLMTEGCIVIKEAHDKQGDDHECQPSQQHIATCLSLQHKAESHGLVPSNSANRDCASYAPSSSCKQFYAAEWGDGNNACMSDCTQDASVAQHQCS